MLVERGAKAARDRHPARHGRRAAPHHDGVLAPGRAGRAGGIGAGLGAGVRPAGGGFACFQEPGRRLAVFGAARPDAGDMGLKGAAITVGLQQKEALNKRWCYKSPAP